MRPRRPAPSWTRRSWTISGLSRTAPRTLKAAPRRSVRCACVCCCLVIVQSFEIIASMDVVTNAYTLPLCVRVSLCAGTLITSWTLVYSRFLWLQCPEIKSRSQSHNCAIFAWGYTLKIEASRSKLAQTMLPHDDKCTGSIKITPLKRYTEGGRR